MLRRGALTKDQQHLVQSQVAKTDPGSRAFSWLLARTSNNPIIKVTVENHSPRERVVPMCTMLMMMMMMMMNNKMAKMIGLKSAWIHTMRMMMSSTTNAMKNGMRHTMVTIVPKWIDLPLHRSGIRAKLQLKTNRSSMWRSSMPSTLHMLMRRAVSLSSDRAVVSTQSWFSWMARAPTCLQVGVLQSQKAKKRDPNKHHIHQRGKV